MSLPVQVVEVFDILVIGDCVVDLYVEAIDYTLPKDSRNETQLLAFVLGSKVRVKNQTIKLAGNACHVAVGLAKLGYAVQLYTELGDDQFADEFFRRLYKEHVDTTICKKNKEQSTNVHPVVIAENDRVIFAYHFPRHYDLDFKKLVPTKWLYYTSLSEGFEPFNTKLLRYLTDTPQIGVAFNPGSYMFNTQTSALFDVLHRTDVLFVNKEEAKKICELCNLVATNLKGLHTNLINLGPKISVITDGKNGASCFDGQTLFDQPPLVVQKVVDKTGAGDAFSVGFMGALLANKPLSTALLWGARNAASTLGDYGAIDGFLTKDQLLKL